MLKISKNAESAKCMEVSCRWFEAKPSVRESFAIQAISSNFQVDLKALIGEASAALIADVVPFGATCMPIPVFNATRLFLCANSYTILSLESEMQAPNIGERAFRSPQMRQSEE